MTAPASPASSLADELRHFGRTVACVLFALVALKLFVFETSPVHGPSMEPTLHSDERILVFKLPVLLGRLPLPAAIDPIEPGDLVVFENRAEAGKRYVKRLIAEGPARPRGRVVSAEARGAAGDGVPVRFDHGAVFVNNRRIDEPYLVPEERRSPDQAAAVLRAGEYYVLGDHRSVSKDSRRIGAVDEDQIVGKAVWRVWPPAKFGPL